MTKKILNSLKTTVFLWFWILGIDVFFNKSSFILEKVSHIILSFLILFIFSMFAMEKTSNKSEKTTKKIESKKIDSKIKIMGRSLLEAVFYWFFIVGINLFYKKDPFVLKNIPFAIGVFIALFLFAFLPKLERFLEEKNV